MSPVDVVQRQVEAYNNRDLNRFVSTYSEIERVWFFSPERAHSPKAMG